MHAWLLKEIDYIVWGDPEMGGSRRKEIKSFTDPLVCPCCNFYYTHQVGYEIFAREHEDSEKGIYVRVGSNGVVVGKSVDEGNPSLRRDGLKVYFWCEGCPALFFVSIYQHKGQTFMGSAEVLTSNKEHRKQILEDFGVEVWEPELEDWTNNAG